MEGAPQKINDIEVKPNNESKESNENIEALQDDFGEIMSVAESAPNKNADQVFLTPVMYAKMRAFDDRLKNAVIRFGKVITGM